MQNEIYESKRVQLLQLQERIGLHGSRMWQLPLTYLGGISLALTAAGSDKFQMNWGLLFALLALLGLIFLYCLFGAHEGYKRTATAMNEVEKFLGLTEWTKCHYSHTAPYWIMMIFGFFICFGASVYAFKDPTAFSSNHPPANASD